MSVVAPVARNGRSFPVPAKTARWYTPADLPARERPTGPRYWAWLTDPAPLTPKLRAHAGEDLGLTVLQVGPAHPWPDEWPALDITPRHRILRREILFTVRENPWVYATTTVSETDAATLPWLAQLGNEALGDHVFVRQGGRRLWLEIGRLGYGAPLARQARMLLHPDRLPDPLWARRSLLQCGRARLLVHEIFLRGATPWRVS
jgi:chorismate-pyruvate lyase